MKYLAIKAFGIATLSIGAFGSMSTCAFANDEVDQIWEAGAYARDNRSVAVLVSGRTTELTSKQIADHIVGFLDGTGETININNDPNFIAVDAAAFFRQPNRIGVAVRYILYDMDYGPYSGHNWKEGAAEVRAHSISAFRMQATDQAKARLEERLARDID